MRNWLELTEKQQREVYGHTAHLLGEYERTHYIKDMVFAAYNELGEMAREFSWKPWANDEPFVNREALIEEAVDVMMFIGNVLIAVGCSDREFEQAYMLKTAINQARQLSDYRVKDKLS